LIRLEPHIYFNCVPIGTQFFDCMPSMGNNLVVKVHYGLGSRNR